MERDGVLYYQRRVPKAVIDQPGALARYFNGQAIVRRTLGTKDRIAAIGLAEEMTRQFNELVSKALDTSAALKPRTTRSVTPEILRVLSDERRARREREFAQYRLMKELGGENAEIVDDIVYQYEIDAEHQSGVIAGRVDARHPSHDYDTMALDVIESEGLDAPVGSLAFGAVRLALKEADVQGVNAGFEVWQGRKSFLDSTRSNQRSPKLSDAVNAYLLNRQKKRTVDGVREAFRCFEKVVGDLHLHALTAEHFRAFCRAQATLDIGGRSRGSVTRPMSAETIDKKLAFLRGAIKHAIDQGEFIGPNVASGITSKPFVRPSDPLVMPEKRPFTSAEISRILAYPWFTGCESETRRHRPGSYRLGGMWYWGPLVALLTGCRAAEIGGLLLSEVMLDEKYPHLLIRTNEHRTTKGGYSRKVPILDQLLELGFGEFVDHQRRAGAHRLFDDWPLPSNKSGHNDKPISNGPMVRSFNTTLLPAALKGIMTAERRKEVTFHSFRGAFKTLLTKNEYQLSMNYIHEVVGHAKSNLDKRYIGEIDISETYPAVRKCRYEDIAFPPPPPFG
ncbi:tyrosine-type recombinase/integrase [Novosphingobium sp. ES2-1]|uniref:tyrosine-type recombinase/integrase n=1 Tax=Novosphingobium sp. ES2-1 TaxID=2780074 RepID=UPI001880C1F2|nr:tyrosine-type recombinase/integrase [Novosphingobium sp. ES2-1]QOV94231.1 tyrosine-type recombinase/integrase [Novosphingobium sp. ES2-1]